MSTSRRALFLFALLSSPAALAGPLDPPAGPVTGTYKTLTEVEPRVIVNATNTPGDASCLFKINRPGSYYLTDNIVAPAGYAGTGILVVANNVTLDLNGFKIIGPGATGADGIRVEGFFFLGLPPNPGENPNDVTIRNGTIRSWGRCGVVADNLGQPPATVTNVRVENVTAEYCPEAGFRVKAGGALTGCIADGCGYGFTVDHATLTHCAARGNSDTGFQFNRSQLSDCVSDANTGAGFYGYTGGRADHCVATKNYSGFILDNGSAASDCSASTNTAWGLDVRNKAVALSCTATENGLTPIEGTNAGGIIVRGDSARVETCTASGNGTVGITLRMGSGCLIAKNLASQNGSDRSNNIQAFGGQNFVGPILTDPTLISTAGPWANFAY